MKEAEFWRIIEMTKIASNGNDEKQVGLLIEYLSQLNEGEILEFDKLFVMYQEEAYDWRLWGAAYIIEGGCSDDCFTDFLVWLTVQGREVYEQALANPDSLADYVVIGQPIDIPEMRYVTHKAYEAKTGRNDMLHRAWSRIEPTGEAFKEEDLPQMYPKLEAKFNNY
jgi:hypothetical protein